MNSRERVMAAFDHVEPDRVPIWVGTTWEFREKAKTELGLDDEGLHLRFGDDFRRVGASYSGPKVALQHPAARFRTAFGVEHQGMGYGQPVNHPLAGADRGALEKYPWPDPAWVDASQCRAQGLAWKGQYAMLGGDWSPFWHDIIELVGMEELYMRMYDEPEFVDALLGHVVDYYFESSRRIFDAAGDVLDIFFFGNDFGSQRGALLGPAQFERFILPHLRRLIRLGHDYRLKVQLHCCGGYTPLIPLLIGAGLDAVQAVQPTCCGMDLASLKADFGDRLVFNGAIDSHHVLIEGSVDLVRAQTRRVVNLMKPGGGYIACPSHDSVLEETPVANILAMCDTIRECGEYKAKK